MMKKEELEKQIEEMEIINNDLRTELKQAILSERKRCLEIIDKFFKSKKNVDFVNILELKKQIEELKK